MGTSFFAGLAIIAVSGIVNATYPLPLKYSRTWKWENTWLVFTVLALVLIPWGCAYRVVPQFDRVLAEMPLSEAAPGLLLGGLWGMAQVTFGVSLGMVGMAMAFAILVGVSTVVGSFIPMAVLEPQALRGQAGVALAASAALLAVGLFLYARAAGERDAVRGKARASFAKGLAICLFTGALAGLINLGFAFSGDLLKRAMSVGASPSQATFAVWPVVLAGGAVPNLAYTCFLLVRRGSWRAFRQDAGREMTMGMAMAVLWAAGVFGYGLGTSVMGARGTSIGYAVFQIVLMLWSTTLGVMTGEWRAAPPAAMLRMRAGVAVIVAAVVVLSVSGV